MNYRTLNNAKTFLIWAGKVSRWIQFRTSFGFQIDRYIGIRWVDGMFRCLTAFLALALITEAEEVSKSLFDLPLKEGAMIRQEALKNMLPASVFAVRKTMNAEALIAALSDCRMELMKEPSFSPWVSGETPESAHFENIEAHWEKGKLRTLSLSAYRLPPSEGRLTGFVNELGNLLGQPTAAYRKTQYQRVDPLSLVLVWRNEPDELRLSMNRGGRILTLKLEYFPGPANPGLARVNSSSPLDPLEILPLDKLMTNFIKEIDFLLPGDGTLPQLPLPESEKDMLAAYSSLSVTALKTTRDWRTRLLPFRERLNKALQDHYSNLTITERYQRLLDIAEAKVLGLSSGEVQVGAAAFLGSHDGDEVINFLLKGMEVELPSGVEMECANGIASQCEGEMMDRVILMLDSPKEWDKGTSILTYLSTPEQLAELRLKARNVKPKIRTHLQNIIDLLRRRDGME